MCVWDPGCTPGTACPGGCTSALGKAAVAAGNWAASHWVLHTGCKSKKEEAHGAGAVGRSRDGRQAVVELRAFFVCVECHPYTLGFLF